MDKGVCVPPGQGKVWTMAPGRSAALKMLNGDTANSVMMFEEVAPASTETPMHTHDDSDEVAYVLSGQITFKIGDEITVGGPGTCAFMPRGLAHAWKNTGAQPGRVLFLYAPGRAGKFFEEAVEMGRPFSLEDEQIAEASTRHRWRTVGPPVLCAHLPLLPALT